MESHNNERIKMKATIKSDHGKFVFVLKQDGNIYSTIKTKTTFEIFDSRTKYHGDDMKEFALICRNIFKAYTEHRGRL